MKSFLITLFALLTALPGFATTWDEPWQKEIIEKSDYFVYGQVVDVTDTSVTIEVTKNLGTSTEGKIQIDGFFLLDFCSFSGGHGPEFNFQKDDKGYFFLKKGENGNYHLPTPTSGFDRVLENKVHATYRHSYHQAAVAPDIYELTYKEIWKHFHQGAFDKVIVEKFMAEQLSQKPAGFEEDEIELFFRQHAALETAYLLGIALDFETVKKFSESDNFHAQVSALRAMENIATAATANYLLEYIQAKGKENFPKVIAIWSFWKIADENQKKQLLKFSKKLSDEYTGFGGNIMDPRVCTRFPSPKGAVEELKETH